MTYKDDLLEGIVRLWNSSLSQKRKFRAITPQILRSYCMSRDDFDPEGLFLAIENHEVVGMGHAGFAKKGSDQERGLIHVLVVRPDLRRKGIGGRLLNSCESFLSRASMITMGATGEDAFYSHSRFSLLPLWGSSEGIGIEASDYETRGFEKVDLVTDPSKSPVAQICIEGADSVQLLNGAPIKRSQKAEYDVIFDILAAEWDPLTREDIRTFAEIRQKLASCG